MHEKTSSCRRPTLLPHESASNDRSNSRTVFMFFTTVATRQAFKVDYNNQS